MVMTDADIWILFNVWVLRK